MSVWTKPHEDYTVRIAHARKIHKLSLKAMGEMLGVNLLTIWRWENGKKLPTPTNEMRLRQLLSELEQKEWQK